MAPAAPGSLQDIPGGHPYMLSLGILGGIYAFENPLQGCLLVSRAGATLAHTPHLCHIRQAQPAVVGWGDDPR